MTLPVYGMIHSVFMGSNSAVTSISTVVFEELTSFWLCHQGFLIESLG